MKTVTIKGSANPFANAATMIAQSVVSPGHPIAIDLPEGESLMARANRNWKPGQP